MAGRHAGKSVCILTVPRFFALPVWLTGLLLWTAVPVLAQAPSRAALLRAQREAKVETTSEPERTGTEKRLRDIAKFSRFTAISWKGFQFAGGDFPSGAGFNFGVGFRDLAVGSVYEEDDLPNRVDVNLVAATSTSQYYQVSGDFAFRNLGGSPFSAGVRAMYYEWPQQDFYGLGPDSQEDNRTNYLIRSVDVGAGLWLEPKKGLRVGVGAFFTNPRIGAGRDTLFPSTDEVAPPGTLPGLETQPDFLRINGLVDFDWTDKPLYPRSGGYYGVQIANFKDQDLDHFNFRRYEVDLQQYIPFRNKYSVVALRALTVITDAESGNEVPFYYMPTLGGGDRLRGFREGRFTDNNSLLLTAEYRWEAWWPLDMALFVDAGQVAADRKDLFEDLDVSYGIGFRFHNSEAVVLRMDFSFSREGFIFFLRYSNVFNAFKIF